MPRPDRGRLRALLASSAALIAMLLVTVLIPSTSSAFTALVTNTTDTARAKSTFTCADTFAGDRRKATAYFEFSLSEAADATTAVDSSDANDPGTYRGAHAVDGDSPTACPNDANGAYRLDGSSSRVSTGRLYSPITGTFSEEVWFRTSGSGKLLGFESTSDDRSNNYDKHLYVGQDGKLIFGIYNGGIQTLQTGVAVNDGAWHYAVATVSSAGTVLYLDGTRADSSASITTAENYSGYWRLGWGNLDGGWPDIPGGSNWFTGSLRFAAAYPFVLSADEVASAWSIGRPGAVAAPAPTASATPSASATPAASSSAAPSSSASPSASASTGSAGAKGGQATSAPAPSDVSTTPGGAAPSS